MIDLGKIADTTQQPVYDTGRAAPAFCDLVRAVLVDLDIQNISRTFADGLQIVDAVKIEMKDDPETPAKRRVIKPGLVVAPTSVNFGSSSFIDLAAAPCPIMMSML